MSISSNRIIPRECPCCGGSAKVVSLRQEPFADLYKIDSELKFPLRHCHTCDLRYFDLLDGFNTNGEIYKKEGAPLSTLRFEPRHSTFKKMILGHCSLLQFRQDKKIRILELGSGHSMLAKELAFSGCQVTVVDLEPCQDESYLENGGSLTVVRADMNSMNYDSFLPASFDWIIMDNVLEHLPRFRTLLDHANTWLDRDNDGAFLVAVPNYNTIKRFVSSKYLAEHQFRPVEHVNMFSAKSLDWLFHSLGFKRGKLFFQPKTLMDVNIFLSVNFFSWHGIYRVYRK